MKRMSCLLALGSVLWATPSLAGPSGTTQCYLLANNATATVNTPYVPIPAYNAGGGAITVTHTGTGTYTAECFGLNVGGFGLVTLGNVQVTAVGPSNIYCHAESWEAGTVIVLEPPAATPPIIQHPPITFERFIANVVCFGPGGGGGGGPRPFDSEFSLLFVY